MRLEPSPQNWEHPIRFSAIPRKHIEGVQFIATMQLRTPLYVLKRHGVVLDPREVPPPDFPQWAGVWSLKPKSLNSLMGVSGLDERLESTRTSATPIGPQPTEDIHRFLIQFRQIIESDISDAEVVAEIEALRINNRWSDFVAKFGGAEMMIARSGEPRR